MQTGNDMTLHDVLTYRSYPAVCEALTGSAGDKRSKGTIETLTMIFHIQCRIPNGQNEHIDIMFW